MAKFSEFFRNLFTPAIPLPEGMHQLQVNPPDQPPYRLHLRLHPDGSGILIVNAATVLHLNPTAAEYAYHFVKGTSPELAARMVASRYRVNRKQALQDMNSFSDRIQTLISTPDLDPVAYMDFGRVAPHSVELPAPLRLDCAITYRLPRGADTSRDLAKRVTRELNTGEWQTIFDKAWHVGIPHLVFTGGEPTLRQDLPELVAHAEQNGQVAGLLSDGLKLTEKAYLNTLLQTGLDHLMLVLQPENKDSWKAVEIVMPEDLFTTVHLTITAKNLKKAGSTLQRLASLGVTSLSLSLADTKLQAEFSSLRDRAAELGLSLKWDLPVPYSAANPVTLETTEDETLSGAGKAWLYVEPDGDVLPAQGMANQVLGNFLKDPWEKICPH